MTDQPQPRGLPGWAIALIIAGGALALTTLIGGLLAISALGTFLASARDVPVAPLPPSAEAPALPDSPESSDSTPPGSAAQAQEDTDAIIELHEKYGDAIADGSITGMVPGGDAVDPDYIAAYLYSLTDLRSALRFVPASAENAAQLRVYAEQAEELERRFLAGEDLDVRVRITRDDGSVFESDGKYRTVTP
ncbi:hypothetical protein [Leucobacter luti]|uniref:Uncharacterized protein n=1 Tax=Leucobacter luti TaxID=340320 RepID=A0A4Q7TNT0_9MICO|nr:hypothetical protein [Leucobacter luti]MBL3700092.1 hypothetical protein [Leucobacter luti]RZT61188.1 hypothetical protein EV139_2941 [Leucobacter luti]